MAPILTSTTEPQQNLDHAVSEKWEDASAIKEFKAKAEPVPEAEPETEPVEVPEPEAEPEVPAEEPEPETETEAAEAKPKPKSGWQKRIDKLTARNHQLESRLQELEAKVKPAEEAKPQEGLREPKFAEYNGDIDKFIADRDAWKDAREKQTAELTRRKEVVETYNEKVSAARGQYDDWDEVVAGSKAIVPQAAIDAVIELDNGPDVAYYLAQHPEDVETLGGLSAIRTIQFIGKLSDKLVAEKEKPAPKAKVQPPAPITPVTSAGVKSSQNWWEVSPAESVRILNKRDHDKRMGKI